MRFYYSVLALLFLGACASLTKEECRNANWRSIGYNDGINGQLESYVSRHFKACGKIGITPDVPTWLAGRLQGLPLYCTPANAYDTGRAGNDLSPVCPAAQQSTLFQSWDWGQEYYVITQQIDTLNTESQDIQHQIATTLSTPPLTLEQSRTLATLNDRLRWIEAEIYRLENRRSRYAAAPI